MKYIYLIFKVMKILPRLVILALNVNLKKNFEGKRAFKRMLSNYDIDKEVISELSKEYSKLVSNNMYTQYENSYLKKNVRDRITP